MSGWVFSGGNVVPADAATVPFLDRGHLLGDALFDVLRVYDGAPFAFAEHLERLGAGARAMGFDLPFDGDALVGAVRDLLARQGGDGSLRIVVSRGEGLGLSGEGAGPPRWRVYLGPLREPAPSLRRHGVRALLWPHAFGADLPSSLKAGSYVGNVLATRAAVAAGAHEALRVRRGRIIEGASSSVAALRGGVLIAPPVVVGCLDSVTRRMLLALCEKLGLRHEARALRVDELCAVDELLLASTIREVLPVVGILDGGKETPIGDGRPGPITGRLRRAFHAEAGRAARREWRRLSPSP